MATTLKKRPVFKVSKFMRLRARHCLASGSQVFRKLSVNNVSENCRAVKSSRDTLNAEMHICECIWWRAEKVRSCLFNRRLHTGKPLNTTCDRVRNKCLVFVYMHPVIKCCATHHTTDRHVNSSKAGGYGHYDVFGNDIELNVLFPYGRQLQVKKKTHSEHSS